MKKISFRVLSVLLMTGLVFAFAWSQVPAEVPSSIDPNLPGLVTPSPVSPVIPPPGPGPAVDYDVPSSVDPNLPGFVTPSPMSPTYPQPAPVQMQVPPAVPPPPGPPPTTEPPAPPRPTAPAVTTPTQTRVRVNNNLLSKAVPGANRQLYVGIGEFLQAAGYSWEMRGTTLFITRGGARPAITTVPTSFCFNGAPFSSHSFRAGDTVYTQGRVLAQQLGLREQFVSAENTYFYLAPGVQPARTTTASSPSGSTVAVNAGDGAKDGQPQGDQGQAAQPKKVTFKDAEISKAAIKPNLTYFYEWRQGTVRGNVTYTNTAKQPIDEIAVVFKIVDGAGSVLYQENHQIGKLNAGARSRQFDLLWTNPSNFPISDSSFAYEITYMEPPQPAAGGTAGK